MPDIVSKYLDIQASKTIINNKYHSNENNDSEHCLLNDKHSFQSSLHAFSLSSYKNSKKTMSSLFVGQEN